MLGVGCMIGNLDLVQRTYHRDPNRTKLVKTGHIFRPRLCRPRLYKRLSYPFPLSLANKKFTALLLILNYHIGMPISVAVANASLVTADT